MTTYIIYHQVKPGVDCPDGMAAAWVAHRKYPDASVTGRAYVDDRPLPELEEGDRVYLVDFSIPATILNQWYVDGVSVTVIDHHKTAMEALQDLSKHIRQEFDMDECGATLAWKTFFPDEAMPAFLEFIRKRDLWLDCELFADPIPETLVVHEAIAQMKMDAYEEARFHNMTVQEWIFGKYDWLADRSRDGLLAWANHKAMHKLEEKQERVKAIAARHVEHPWTWPPKNLIIPVVVLAPDGSEDRYTSDVCMCLYRQFPLAHFVACITSDGSWSLRSDSKGNNTDVGAIAKELGGGGHRNAAGFKP